MARRELELRTKTLALEVIPFVDKVDRGWVAAVLSRQLLKSGTSIGANYREAAYAESRNDFRHKIGIVTKEAAETEYWIDLLIDSGLAKGDAAKKLHGEAIELVSIFVSIGRSLKENYGPTQVRDSANLDDDPSLDFLISNF